MLMAAWYDVTSIDSSGPIPNRSEFLNARNYIHALIREEEASGIKASRIVVAGFSQGGSVASYATLTYPRPLGGLIAMSTWFPFQEDFKKGIGDTRDVPVLQLHGDLDLTVTCP